MSRYVWGIFLADVTLALLCALNVWMALMFDTVSTPLNWAVAVFIALLLLRPRR